MVPLAYHANDGSSVDLTDYDDYVFITARRGFIAPPIRAITEQIPNVAGARYVGQIVGERTLSVGISVLGDSFSDAFSKIEDVAAIMTQDGYFLSNGTRRIDVVYNGGFEGDSSARSGQRYTFAPEYRAPSPYWQDVAESNASVIMSQVVSGVTFPIRWPLFFPKTGESASLTAETGDAPTPWRAEITGPLSGITLAKLATREILNITDAAILAGNMLIIDNTPGYVQIYRDNGWTKIPLEGKLSGDSDMWLLEPGSNEIGIQVVSGTTAQITLYWNNRYRGAI